MKRVKLMLKHLKLWPTHPFKCKPAQRALEQGAGSPAAAIETLCKTTEVLAGQCVTVHSCRPVKEGAASVLTEKITISQGGESLAKIKKQLKIRSQTW